MLVELHIEDLGLIERLDLVLGRGLTALTGETGAGKTMLLEAIELLVGGRADSIVVRPGASEARVEGRFVDGDEEWIVARVVPLNGRSRAYIDGRLATVANLAELGRRGVDLHGQHDHQSLLAASVQRAALDRFGAVDLGPLEEARAELQRIDAALGALGGDVRARNREIDLLRFQLAEIATAAIDDVDEDARLDAEESLLADAVAHRAAAQSALGALGDDGGAAEAVRSALGALGSRPPFADVGERLQALAYELDDLVGELRRAEERIEEDPERLGAIRERRQLLRELRRKYGETLEDVRSFEAEAATRLAELEGYEQRAAALEARREAAQEAIARAAAAVGAARRAAAPHLAEEVTARLSALAMPAAKVVVDVGAEDPGDAVEMLLAANPGAPPLPLARVASGGELARTMLALRLVLSEAPDTLVFDEVDAGIGGSAALAVAGALAELGQRHQVLMVTHLAQVAAAADTQIVVAKAEREGRTAVSVRAVDGEERIGEIARMLSGKDDSETARRHAAELISGQSPSATAGRRATAPRRTTR